MREQLKAVLSEEDYRIMSKGSSDDSAAAFVRTMKRIEEEEARSTDILLDDMKRNGIRSFVPRRFDAVQALRARIAKARMMAMIMHDYDNASTEEDMRANVRECRDMLSAIVVAEPLLLFGSDKRADRVIAERAPFISLGWDEGQAFSEGERIVSSDDSVCLCAIEGTSGESYKEFVVPFSSYDPGIEEEDPARWYLVHLTTSLLMAEDRKRAVQSYLDAPVAEGAFEALDAIDGKENAKALGLAMTYEEGVEFANIAFTASALQALVELEPFFRKSPWSFDCESMKKMVDSSVDAMTIPMFVALGVETAEQFEDDEEKTE